MAPLRVLIIGVGIGGPALAFWLSRQDHKVTMVERHPNLRASGQQLDLRMQGVAAVQRMGLLSAVRDVRVEEDGVVIQDDDGSVRASFMASKTGTGKQSFSSDYEIMRGDLCRVLYDAACDESQGGKNVETRFGITVESLEQDESDRDGPVRVTFSDGSKGDFDLVVGADGQASRTRRMMLGLSPGEVDPTSSDLGCLLAFFSLPRTKSDNSLASARLAPGCFTMTRGGNSDKTIQVYYFLKTDDPRAPAITAAWEDDKAKNKGIAEAGKQMKSREAWAGVFSATGSYEAERLADGLVNSPEADDFYAYRATRVECPTWRRGRITLLGDAVCSLGPNGFGTSTAIMGAYVLAGELAKRTSHDKTDVHGGLAAYENEFKPFMGKVGSAKMGRFIPNSQWGVRVFLFVASVLSWLRVDKIALYFATEERGGWQLPEYPELKGGEPLKKDL